MAVTSASTVGTSTGRTVSSTSLYSCLVRMRMMRCRASASRGSVEISICLSTQSVSLAYSSGEEVAADRCSTGSASLNTSQIMYSIDLLTR